MKKTNLKTSTSLWLGRMSPTERALGRYMRSPDGHADAPPAAEQAPAEPAPEAAADAPAAGGDTAADAAPAAPSSILGGAGQEPAAAAADGEPAAAADAPAGEADPAAEAAPYEGLTPPEGYEALDADAVAAATPLMRAFGVADDKAQDFINQAAPVIAGMVERQMAAAASAQAQAQEAIRTEWATTAKADPEFGGAHFPKTVAMCAVTMDRFFDKETRELLDASGLGNYPGLVKGFAKIGGHFAEGEIVTGEPTPARRGDPLYDDRFLPPEQRQA